MKYILLTLNTRRVRRKIEGKRQYAYTDITHVHPVFDVPHIRRELVDDATDAAVGLELVDFATEAAVGRDHVDEQVGGITFALSCFATPESIGWQEKNILAKYQRRKRCIFQ